MTAKEIANRAHGRRSGKGYNGHCPAHEDQHESLSISTGTDGRVLLHCHAGCEVESIVAALGLKMADLFPSKDFQPQPKSEPHTIFYDYRNAEGKLLYQVCRSPEKRFQQRRPDGKGGWKWNLDGIGRVLYNLPAVLRADVICIAEGEKDAETLVALRLEQYEPYQGRTVAVTTNSGGAGKWNPQDGHVFKGKDVLVFEDDDDPGRKHALDVLRSVHPYVKSVRRISLPGLQAKGDVSDWMCNHSVNELLVEIQRTLLWHPEPAATPSAAEAEPESSDVEKPGILEVALEAAGRRDTVRETFCALCIVLQRLRGNQYVVLPVQKIAKVIGCQWSLIARLRRQLVAEGGLKPERAAIPHRQAGRFFVLSDTPPFRGVVIQNFPLSSTPSPFHFSDTPHSLPLSDTPLKRLSDTSANGDIAGGYVEGEL